MLEDLGFIPTVQDWLKELPMRAWMIKGARALETEGAKAAPRATRKRSTRRVK